MRGTSIVPMAGKRPRAALTLVTTRDAELDAMLATLLETAEEDS